MKLDDTQIKKQLKKGRKSVLQYLFDTYYDDLCKYAIKIVSKGEVAEEIVQDVFIYLWEKRKTIEIESSVKYYILRAVKNKCINFLKSKYARQTFDDAIDEGVNLSNCNTYDEMNYKELSAIANDAIESLPERCALVFKLSRNAELSYKEIAEKLEISIKTVENQMTTALKRIREYLDVHWN